MRRINKMIINAIPVGVLAGCDKVPFGIGNGLGIGGGWSTVATAIVLATLITASALAVRCAGQTGRSAVAVR